MNLKFKKMLLTTALALSPLMAGEDGQPEISLGKRTREVEPCAPNKKQALEEQQSIKLTFTKNGQPFIKEVEVGATKLSLYWKGLTGEIPEIIGNLKNLEELSLSDNQLTGAIPETIGNLVNLNCLFLHTNELSGAIPESIGNLVNLTSLRLYSNQLSGAIPESIGNLVNLTELFLYSNQLSGAIPESIGNLVNMKHLKLFKNNLTGAIPETIGNLVNLKNLFLDNNQLTGAIPEAIGNLVKLISLSLDNNGLTGEIPETIGNLVNLEYLSLSNNQLTGEIPQGLWGLPKLLRLGLHGNALFGQQILTNQSTINTVNAFFSVTSETNESCSIRVSDDSFYFASHFTDEGVWQNDLIERNMQTFTRRTAPLQAVLIAELANYGYAQQMVFTFEDGRGTLTIHPAVNGSPRVIDTSEDAQLGGLVEELNKLHMPLGQFMRSAESGEHPVGLIYPPSCTKSARKITK